MDESRRRALADTAVAMRWAGDELTGHAWQVVERVFEHLGVSDDQTRDDRLQELFTDMELGHYRPKEVGGPISLNQGKVAIDVQRKHHADQALRQAVAVQHEYQTILAPMTAPGMREFGSGLQLSYQRMQSCLLEAQRHLAALDILKNLEGKHYSQRARKGGHTRSRPASEQDQQTLLAVMVKNMLYKNADTFKRADSRTTAVAKEWAVKIYEFDCKFGMLNISSLGNLQASIHTLLIKFLNDSQDVSNRHIHRRVMARQLRQRKDTLRSEEADRIEAELVYERGFREGIQGVLLYLLEERFGELPEEALEVIRVMQRVEEMQACLDRLPEMSTWQAVLGERESASGSR